MAEISISTTLDSELRPYLEAACKGDWCPPLTEKIQNTEPDKLIQILNSAEENLKNMGYAGPGSLNAMFVMYLNRIRSLVKRHLYKLEIV
ncbi:hypothetical protein ABX026_01355 [Snodgrassella alvi]|uniref:hypothetical protein n=1 Tax=Snodgrassella TaxID=1193515 RepID=UPI0018DE9C67|nr:hypothetical protein [Snodgrassella sp. W8158]MBI0182094.1 hypothetical protein [Snodgrassella sp. W8158]